MTGKKTGISGKMKANARPFLLIKNCILIGGGMNGDDDLLYDVLDPIVFPSSGLSYTNFHEVVKDFAKGKGLENVQAAGDVAIVELPAGKNPEDYSKDFQDETGYRFSCRATSFESAICAIKKERTRILQGTEEVTIAVAGQLNA